MGLFSAYLWYRHGKKKGERRAAQEEEFASTICDNCGYEARQHSDEGECPSY